MGDLFKIKSLAKQIAKDTLKNGGSTTDILGNHPTDGYCYSPYKDTEVMVPKEAFSYRYVAAFITANFGILYPPGFYIGTWEDDGFIYLDVSVVGPPTEATMEKARKAEQIAVFDLSAGVEINLA